MQTAQRSIGLFPLSLSLSCILRERLAYLHANIAIDLPAFSWSHTHMCDLPYHFSFLYEQKKTYSFSSRSILYVGKLFSASSRRIRWNARDSRKASGRMYVCFISFCITHRITRSLSILGISVDSNCGWIMPSQTIATRLLRYLSNISKFINHRGNPIFREDVQGSCSIGDSERCSTNFSKLKFRLVLRFSEQSNGAKMTRNFCDNRIDMYIFVILMRINTQKHGLVSSWSSLSY